MNTDLDLDHPGSAESNERSVSREIPLEDWKRFASEAGYTPRYEGDHPASLLDLYVNTGGSGNYEDLLRAAHDMGWLADSFSSRTVDNLRAVMEMSVNKQDIPLLEMAKALGEDEVVEHWHELSFLYGLHGDTSLTTIERDQENQRRDRQHSNPHTHRQPEPGEIRQAERINAGTIPFESQGRGGHHPWGGPGGWQ